MDPASETAILYQTCPKIASRKFHPIRITPINKTYPIIYKYCYKVINIFGLNFLADLSPGLNLKLLPNISNWYPSTSNSNRLLCFGIPRIKKKVPRQQLRHQNTIVLNLWCHKNFFGIFLFLSCSEIVMCWSFLENIITSMHPVSIQLYHNN